MCIFRQLANVITWFYNNNSVGTRGRFLNGLFVRFLYDMYLLLYTVLRAIVRNKIGIFQILKISVQWHVSHYGSETQKFCCQLAKGQKQPNYNFSTIFGRSFFCHLGKKRKENFNDSFNRFLYALQF